MQWYPQVQYDSVREIYQTRLEVAQLRQHLHQQINATNEMLAIIKRNHEILTMIYQRNYGAYPLGY